MARTETPDGRRRVRTVLPRFAAVGASGVAVNLLALWLLHGVLGVPFGRSSALATELAIVWNYAGNERFTFHTRAFSIARLLRFNVASLAGLVVTVLVAELLQRAAAPYLAAQLLGIAAGGGLNFAANFLWTWGRRTGVPAPIETLRPRAETPTDEA